MPHSNYPKGFAQGVTVQNLPILNTYSNNVFWVDSNNGSDGNKGTFDRPFASIDKALDFCTDDRGDVIALKEGHAETLSAAQSVDKSGVKILGMGHNPNNMPQISIAADVSFTVDSNNVLIQGVRFTAAANGITAGLVVSASVVGTSIVGCYFDQTGSNEFSRSIRVNDACNFTHVSGCFINQGLQASITGVSLTNGSDNVTVEDCVIRGDYSVANIQGTTEASTNVLIRNNILENGVGGDLNAQPVIELNTGTTGTIADNYCVCNLATKAASIVADTCLLFENYYNEDISSAATGGIIGTASADD
jgi:hypothetical protein